MPDSNIPVDANQGATSVSTDKDNSVSAAVMTKPSLGLGKKAVAAASGFLVGGSLGFAAAGAIALSLLKATLLVAVLTTPVGWIVGGAVLGALVLGAAIYAITRACTPDENERSELLGWFNKGAAVGVAAGATAGVGVGAGLVAAAATGAAFGAIYGITGIYSYLDAKSLSGENKLTSPNISNRREGDLDESHSYD